MNVEINGTEKEIAALVVGLQERQREFVPETAQGRCEGIKIPTGNETGTTTSVP